MGFRVRLFSLNFSFVVYELEDLVKLLFDFFLYYLNLVLGKEYGFWSYIEEGFIFSFIIY